MAAQVTPEVQRVLDQLEPILARWYNDGLLGEVTIVFGGQQMQLEERPRYRHEPTKFERATGRVDVIKRTGG